MLRVRREADAERGGVFRMGHVAQRLHVAVDVVTKNVGQVPVRPFFRPTGDAPLKAGHEPRRGVPQRDDHAVVARATGVS